jgi:hypothetical protein
MTQAQELKLKGISVGVAGKLREQALHTAHGKL